MYSSTGSDVSKEASHGFIDEFVPLSGLPTRGLATPEQERGWIRTERRNLVSVDIILVERPTLRSSTPAVFDADKSEVDPTTPKKRTQYRPLQFLNARPRLTFTLITIGTYSNRASRKSKVATQPRAADRVNPPSVSDGYETCQCIARSQRRQSQRR